MSQQYIFSNLLYQVLTIARVVIGQLYINIEIAVKKFFPLEIW